MKKHLLICIIGLCMLAIPTFAEGNEILTPTSCTIENKRVYEPLNVTNIYFAGKITVAEDAKALITCDGKTVATGTIKSDTYQGQGIAVISFDKLILPKGRSYQLEVPSGTISLKSNPTIKAENLKFSFTVPSKIQGKYCSVKDGATVTSERLICFYFETETEPIGEPEMTLYREGLPVRTFKANVGWDWNLGQAYADFGEKMNFEKGVHYSLVLPEGSLKPRFRTDITNEEAKVDFVGGYTEPMETINYVGCNILDNKDGVLNEVRFFYNQPIMLSPNAKIQLFGNNNKLIKEATPVLTKEKEQWVVSCNFGGVEVPHEGCYIVIPAGSIISVNGNVVVNSKNVLSVTNPTGIGKVSNNDVGICVSGRQVIIDNAPLGETLSIYSVNGTKIANSLVSSSHIVLELPSEGIYIVSINGYVNKIVVR